jgi:DNA-3-methyladenine glycosylase I
MKNTVKSTDKKKRCSWAESAPEFPPYHDKEWGFPVKNDQRLFEKLCLEGFQSGLSWRTILVKRENFRIAFNNFEIEKVSKFSTKKVESLLKNEGIIRHRGKIEATINNAKKAKELAREFGSLAKYFWSFEPDPKTLPPPQSVSKSDISEKISKDLKKRGWKFVGPTTIYSFMQAMGLVNDHSKGCFCRELVDKKKQSFKRP